MHANGEHDRLILSEGGFEQDKFPLERVSAEWVRRTFGAGHYRGNWFARVDGRWKALGQMQELRMSSSTGSDVRTEARSRPLRTVGFPFVVPAAAAAPADPEEERVVVNLRVRAEREIAEMRIKTMTELEKIRLEGMRDEHTRDVKRLEQRLEELARRRREEEEEEEDDDDDRGPPGPWDFLAPFIQEAVPMLQEALPGLIAHWMGASPPMPPAPEPKKG